MIHARGRLLPAMLLVGAALVMPLWPARAADEAHMDKMIESAKTAADHEAIAAQYDKLAAEATAKAAEHKVMAERYRRAVGPGSKGGFAEHCDGLVVIYNGAAKEYKALADMHRAQAKSAH